MLNKKYRLPVSQFPVVYKNGKKTRGKYGMLIALKIDNTPTPQFGFVVSKKIGGAVQRHRFTRILRVAVAESIKELSLDNCGYIFQYVAFESCDSKDALKEEVKTQLKGFAND